MTAPAPVSPARPVSVRGGTGGIEADCDEIVAMAARFGSVGTETLRATVALHGYLLDPAITVTAAFDPGGYAVFESDLALALDGPGGLSWAAAEAAAVDAELRGAAAAYLAADQLCGDLHDAVVGAIRMPVAVGVGTAVLARTHDPLAAAQAAVARDPQVADAAVDALGVQGLISAAALALPDGRGVVRRPSVARSGAGATVPRRLTDVFTDLAERDDDLHHGEIDVRILTLPDGSRRVIVDITGTKSWDPLPTHDITNLTTNGRALIGRRTAYEDGVLAAMRRSGVRRSDKVMLVGHSQGGMVAVTTARDAAASGEFDVTHVVTAGSPIGGTVNALPSSIRVLALENRRDVVPHLDGVQNPDRRNVTTVTASRGDGTIIGDHALARSYVPAAADAQANTNRSVRDYLASARSYFGARTVHTDTYQIQRR